ncbi:glycine/D-amino acid oxidase-like deaminating enzyme [Dongia mobilis]|uniref:Glycine/D-amino acid oxidase-like deaminating enzyme n=1 Tax=Dongia mobilis TaxID=578943 RepID=A0A4R6WWM8_9PROT|nr:FAD-binding oxidoreductase [Dongia mobilis]TDQ84620.1 glycine/D-amino acid oxidase-like deaminating enzyme [Dongia mobilis]
MKRFDVVIIGGGVIGSSAAYFLGAQPDFTGSIAVIEKDPTYAEAATPRSAGGIRLQFSTAENVLISQFGAAFIKAADQHLGVGGEGAGVEFREQGYLFLATGAGLKILLANQRLQHELGAATELMNPRELSSRFPWLNVADIAGGSFGPVNEGWTDPYSLLQAFKRKARAQGATYFKDTAVGLEHAGGRVTAVQLAGGESIACGHVINAAGIQGRRIAAMAGIDLPVHPRKRFVYVFDCRDEIENVPLTIDPSGVWFRPEGPQFIAGVSPDESDDPDAEDFELDYRLFEELIWPTLAERVPAFEAIKLVRAWAGHYDYNAFDQNVIIGFAPGFDNLLLANGFSGHGLQQSPAIGRALSELVTFGQYRSLDLRRFGFERLASGAALQEINVV